MIPDNTPPSRRPALKPSDAAAPIIAPTARMTDTE